VSVEVSVSSGNEMHEVERHLARLVSASRSV